ncbi:hypothetical protein JOB18_008494 [Solea senegalensis]|uniref:Uncharacterized protein n=1 Tax=Solea senegalensis TaxID=28829 RepID=A0AAV6Q0M9_SOLSE|nr:hypothetical protein JOB18_008494 [Solea senegalensis]
MIQDTVIAGGNAQTQCLKQLRETALTFNADSITRNSNSQPTNIGALGVVPVVNSSSPIVPGKHHGGYKSCIHKASQDIICRSPANALHLLPRNKNHAASLEPTAAVRAYAGKEWFISLRMDCHEAFLVPRGDTLLPLETLFTHSHLRLI